MDYLSLLNLGDGLFTPEQERRVREIFREELDYFFRQETSGPSGGGLQGPPLAKGQRVDILPDDSFKVIVMKILEGTPQCWLPLHVLRSVYLTECGSVPHKKIMISELAKLVRVGELEHNTWNNINVYKLPHRPSKRDKEDVYEQTVEERLAEIESSYDVRHVGFDTLINLMRYKKTYKLDKITGILRDKGYH